MLLQPTNREEKNPDGAKNENEKGITLLEKIIRTHPIWYLQHIGRCAATHLLRPMNEGVHVVPNNFLNSYKEIVLQIRNERIM